MGLLRRMLDGGREARGFGQAASRIPGPLDQARTNAGPLVSNDTSLAHVDVWKCRSLIADSIAMLPLRAHRTQAYRDPGTGVTHTFMVRVPNQPVLLTDPMPGDLAPEYSLKHRLVDSILGDGNAYLEVGAVDAAGFPSVLMPIHPTKVRDVRLDTRGRVVYEMHDGGVMGGVRDGGTMVHIPGYIQAGSLRGISPIMAGKQAIALGMAAEEFGARWFGDGAHPSGYLSTPSDIDPDDARAMKRGWVQTYGGLSREPAVLYGGLEWKPISVNPEESQFIETRRFQSNQIAALYRVPPHMVGDVDRSTSWGTGIEEMGLGFVTYTLGPWITRIEQAMSFLLPRGQTAKFNVGALLRGRIQDSYQAFATARQWGWLSVNDIRALIDMPPVPGGDTYLQPLNMVDAQAALDVLTGDPAPPPPEGVPA
jgi:HK97 family phage portal protein